MVVDVECLQTLMSVSSTMEGVTTAVPTPMVATTAFVTMDTFWELTISVVQVSMCCYSH